MNEREIWQECVNHCIKNEIIGFNLMFDEFLKMREKEGYKLVPVEPTERMLDSAYSSILDNLHYADLENIYKAMIGAVDEST